MARLDSRLALPAVVTLVLHAMLGALVLVLEPPEKEPEVEITEIEFAPAEPPPPEPAKIEPAPEPVEPEIVPEVEPEIVPEVEPEPPPEPAEPPPEPAEPPPDPPPEPAEPAPSWADPAPGPDTTGTPPGGTYKLDPIGAPGSVAVTPGTSRRPGPGGSGTNTGGGGNDRGAEGPPRPVSVAALSRRPMPIGDTDFVDARKNYPEAAKREGIEGQVKVRLVVDETGKVADRKLVSRLGHGLDELAMRLALELRFEPAIDTAGRPVPAAVVWTFDFTLPE